MLAALAEAQASGVRLAPACRLLGISPRTVERRRAAPAVDDRRAGPKRRPRNALSPKEEALVVSVLTSSRYPGVSPKQLVPQLADDGLYLASEAALYRLQRRHGLRRTKAPTQRRHVTRATTVHQATGPNQVWSWDITWLPTPVRGTYLYLYLIMDVWSRRIVGWHLADEESTDRAAALITRTCAEANVDPRGLVLHSDNGSPMRGSTMRATMEWLGIVPSFSRPHASDDNPYSESLFRTLKYTPAYPTLPFADLGAASRWVTRFVDWYNGTHRHSAIRYVTPNERHDGREHAVLARRHALYERARRANPDRWTRTTRNWVFISLVVLNPERTPSPVAA